MSHEMMSNSYQRTVQLIKYHFITQWSLFFLRKLILKMKEINCSSSYQVRNINMNKKLLDWSLKLLLFKQLGNLIKHLLSTR